MPAIASLNLNASAATNAELIHQPTMKNERDRKIERNSVMRKGITYESAESYVCRWHDSYERLPEILALRRHMVNGDWWRLLGHYWSLCDNTGSFTSELRSHLFSATPQDLHATMRPHERRVLRNLPETLTVYRGCYAINKNGLSWSLSEKVARSFPSLQRYSRPGEDAFLIVGKVPRDRAFLKLDRGEREIVSPSVEIESQLKIAVEDLPTPENKKGRLSKPTNYTGDISDPLYAFFTT